MDIYCTLFLALNTVAISLSIELCTFDFMEPQVDFVLANRNVKHPPQQIPIEVQVKFEQNSVHDVDDNKGTVALDFAIQGRWKDERFQEINCSLEHPFELPFQERNALWSPKFSVLNAHGFSVQQRRGDVEHVAIESFQDQTLTFSRVYALNIPCRFDYRRFPFDEVVCEIRLQPIGSSRGNVEVKWEKQLNSKNAFCKDLDSHAHHLSHFTLERIDIDEDESTSEGIVLNDLWVRLYFERHYHWHLTHIFLQTTIIVLIPWVAFFFSLEVIPPRITMNMSSMVALMVKYNAVMHYLPPVSYFTGLDVWLTGCALYIFAGIAMHTYIVHVKKANVSFKTVPWMTAEQLNRFCSIIYLTAFLAFGAFYTFAMIAGSNHSDSH